MAASCQNPIRWARTVVRPTVDKTSLLSLRAVPRRCQAVRSLFGLLLLLAFATTGLLAEGGTPNSNGFIPTLRVDNLIEGQTATITVANIPAASDDLRVLIAFSRQYGGTDVSQHLGPGAVLVPNVSFNLNSDPIVSPSRQLSGAWPSRSMSVQVPSGTGGRTFYIQALVEDPGAPGGGGFALSEGFAVTVGSGGGSGIAGVKVTPTEEALWVGNVVTYEIELLDSVGGTLPVENLTDIDYTIDEGTGTWYYPHITGDKFLVLYIAPQSPEESVLRFTERASGNNFFALSFLSVRPSEPQGNITITANPAAIPADGASTTMFQGGPVVDEFGNPVLDGRRVTVSVNLGTILTSDADQNIEGIQVLTQNGLFQVSVQSATTSGTCFLSAESTEGSAIGAGSALFTESGPTVASVTMTPDQVTRTVGGAVTLTAELRDGSGQLVNATSVNDVTFTLAPGSGSFSGNQLVSGRVRVVYNVANTVEIATIRATETVSGLNRTDTSAVTSIPGPPSGAISIAANPSIIPADGVSTSTIQGGPITDIFGNIVANGTLITMSASRGNLVGSDADGSNPGIQRSIVSGFFSITLRSSEDGGTSVVTGTTTTGSSSGSVNVEFTPVVPDVTNLVLTPPFTTIEAAESVLFTAELRDGDNQLVAATAVQDVAFTVSPGSGTFSGAQLFGGRVRMTYTAANTVEIATIRATETVSGKSRSDSSPVTSIPGPPTGSITINTNPSSIPADGTSTSSIQGGPVTDSFGNLVANGTLATVSTNRGALIGSDVDGSTPGIQRSIASGFFTISLQSSEDAGTCLITGITTTGSSSGSGTVEFTPVIPEVESMVMTPSFANIEAGDTVTFTGELRDGSNNFVAATATQDIAFVVSPGSGTFSNKQLVGGKIQITYHSSQTKEDGRVVAGETVSGNDYTDASWTYATARAPASAISMTPQPPSIPANGQSSSAILSTTITDEYGNVIENDELFTISTNLGQILDADQSGVPGLQVLSTNGILSLTLRSSTFDGTATVTADSNRGPSFGVTQVTFVPEQGVTNVHVSGFLSLPQAEKSITAVVDPRTSKMYVFGETIVEISPAAAFGQRVRATTDQLPTVRKAMNAVWNPDRNVAMIFGGYNPNNFFRYDEVFEYDPFRPEGSRLTLLADRIPFGRSGGAAVWDTWRSKAYLFGGVTSSGFTTSKVLEYDPLRPAGSRFTELVDRLPTTAAHLSAVFLPGRGSVITLGDGTDIIKEFNPGFASGQRFQTVCTLPVARTGCLVSRHPSNDLVYIMGGWTGSFYPDEVLQLNPSNGSIVTACQMPEDIGFGFALPHPQFNRIYTFGGENIQSELDRILEFLPPSNIKPLGGFSNELSGVTSVYAPTTQTTFMFSDGIYEVDRSAPFGGEVSLTSDSFPEEAISRAAVWDTSRNVAYLFGGYHPISRQRINKIYEFNPSLSEGSRLRLLTTFASPQSGGSAVWDDVANVAYLFGGTSGSGFSMRTIHQFNPIGLQVSTLPETLISPASLLSAAWSTRDHKAYIFGDGSDTIFRFDPRASSNRLQAIDTLPTARIGPHTAFDSVHGIIYIVGGWNGGSENLKDVVGFDPAAPFGTRVNMLGELPKGRAYGSAIFDPIHQDALILGGNGESHTIRVLTPQP